MSLSLPRGAWCWRQGEGTVEESWFEEDVPPSSRAMGVVVRVEGEGAMEGSEHNTNGQAIDTRRGRLGEEPTRGGGWSEGERALCNFRVSVRIDATTR